MRMQLWTVMLMLAVGQGLPSIAEGSDEPRFDELTRAVKRDWFQLGLLIQVVGDYQDDRIYGGESGFSIANARLSVGGELDGGFGYFLQGRFDGSPALLDGFLSYRPTESLAVHAGLKKTPFSSELLTGAGSIDFVNRSQVVAALAPNRQVGVELQGQAAERKFRYRVGLFNGNRFSDGTTNDNDKLLSVARVSFHPFAGVKSDPERSLEIAINAAHSEDTDADLVGGQLMGFDGTRRLFGIDARWTYGRLLLAAEALRADLDPVTAAAIEPEGYHLTAGWMVTPRSQLLLRWDSFDGDSLGPESDALVAGYNLWPTSPTEVQLNYVVPTNGQGSDAHQLLVNFQVGF